MATEPSEPSATVEPITALSVEESESYEGTPELTEIEGWAEEVTPWIQELEAASRAASSFPEKAALQRRAWLLRGLVEQAWQYEDLG